MGQIDVVVEAILDRWTGGELGFGPDPEDRRGQDVRSRVAEAFISDLGGAVRGFRSVSAAIGM